MIYKEFDEVEISFRKQGRNGTYWDRGHIVNLKDVPNYYGRTDVFISSARYKSLKEHTEENKKNGDVYKSSRLGVVAGFDGELYYDFIVIDIDQIDTKQVMLFIEHLDINYDIYKEMLRIYFSGSKGYHILIPSTLFDLKPSSWLNKQVLKIVEELCSNVIAFDASLYDKLQAYRLRYTKHSGSNLYKTPIDFQDLSKGLDYIKSLSIQNSMKFNYPEYPTEFMIHLAQMAVDIEKNGGPKRNGDFLEPRENQVNTDFPPMRKRCIYEMLEGTMEHSEDGSPGRMETGIRLAVHFKKEKYGREYTRAIMDVWNSFNRPPLSEARIAELVSTAYKSNYDYGCKDPVHKYYCDTNCFLFTGDANVRKG